MGKSRIHNIPECYSVTVIRSLAEIESVRTVWNEMQTHPNVDIDLYQIVLNTRLDILEPYVILLSYNDRPIAMLVGRIEEKTIDFKLGYKSFFLSKVRSLTVIYGGLMGDMTVSRAELLLSEVIDFLNRKEVDVVFFSQLPLDSPMYQLATSNPPFFCRDYFPKVSLHWRMLLPATLDDFYNSLSTKHRHELRRKDRKLIKTYSGNVTMHCFRKKNEVDRIIRDIEAIAKNTYQRSMGVGFIDSKEVRQRLNLTSEQGGLRAYVMYVEDKPCAFWIGTFYKKTLYLDFTGYDPSYKKYEIGTLLFIRMIENLCQDRVQEIDFGFGDAFYKQHFCDQHWKEASIFVYSPTLKNVNLNFLRTLTTIFAKFVEGIFKRLKLFGWIKRNWRNMLIKCSKQNGENFI